MSKLVNDFIKSCNIMELRKQAITDIGIAKLSSDFEHEDYYSVYLGDIASGSLGQYQSKAICEYFGIKYHDDFEEDWHNIDNISVKIADKLAELCKIPGQFWFGNHEGDSSYGLFYYEEKND